MKRLVTASACLWIGIVGIFAAVFYDFGGATIASGEPWNDENASWMQPPGTALGEGLGSFLAGPPGFGSPTGGFRAVIGVTGDPDAVFDAYAAQDNNNPLVTAGIQIDDLRVREQTSYGGGGVTMDITLNEIDDNAWILVSVIND